MFVSTSVTCSNDLIFLLDQKGTTQDNIDINYSFGIKERISDSKWGMVIVEKNLEQLYIVVKINIPVDAPIGRYKRCCFFNVHKAEMINKIIW